VTLAYAPGESTATDCIHEIFHFARMLGIQARIRPDEIAAPIVDVCKDITDIDPIWADPPPLFLRPYRYRFGSGR
jgi:hypothetical protein